MAVTELGRAGQGRMLWALIWMIWALQEQREGGLLRDQVRARSWSSKRRPPGKGGNKDLD